MTAETVFRAGELVKAMLKVDRAYSVDLRGEISQDCSESKRDSLVIQTQRLWPRTQKTVSSVRVRRRPRTLGVDKGPRFLWILSADLCVQRVMVS